MSDIPPEEPTHVRKDRRAIYLRWREFDHAFPQMRRTMIGLARQMHERGFKHYGIQAVFERARWEIDIRTGPDVEGFKINNDYAALYARQIMAECPDLRGFFRTRAAPASDPVPVPEELEP